MLVRWTTLAPTTSRACTTDRAGRWRITPTAPTRPTDLDYTEARAFDGNMIHFVATQSGNEPSSAVNAWKTLVKGGVTCHEIDCDHLAMMRPEFLMEIGRLLAPVI